MLLRRPLLRKPLGMLDALQTPFFAEPVQTGRGDGSPSSSPLVDTLPATLAEQQQCFHAALEDWESVRCTMVLLGEPRMIWAPPTSAFYSGHRASGRYGEWHLHKLSATATFTVQAVRLYYNNQLLGEEKFSPVELRPGTTLSLKYRLNTTDPDARFATAEATLGSY